MKKVNGTIYGYKNISNTQYVVFLLGFMNLVIDESLILLGIGIFY
ncbi:hypothetical protein [Rodentibacter rarus]|nr:hypothetical protein [Rodentibacter rarus]